MAKAKRQQRRTQGASKASYTSNAANAANASNAARNGKAAQPTTRGTSGGASGGGARAGSAGLSASARAARERRLGGGAPQSRSRYARRPWWRRNLVSLITVGGVAVIVAGFIILAQIRAQTQNSAAAVGIGDPAPAAVVRQVTTVSSAVAAQVGAGGVQSPLQTTPRNTPLLTANGKPEIIYVGADWCPYCAATRWSTVVALSRFGSFTGLTLMRSSSTDTLPNTATFSFQKATYTSPYIVFSATETQDRNGATLATPPPSAASAQATYDAPPYTTQAGGVPFLSYGNQYVETSGLFVPTMLQGLSWQQIAAQLNNPSSPVTQAIVGGANVQTAAICKLTNNQPSSVCALPSIQQLEAGLPQAK